MAGQTTYSPEVSNSKANTLQYAINQMLLKVNTTLTCQIIAITGDRYTIQPLTNYIDSRGKPVEPPLIYNVPAQIVAGDGAGVVIVYAVGDTVKVDFCQRDISTVKKNWEQSNPASYRKFSLSDGIITGYLTNIALSVFIKIAADGITITTNDQPLIVNGGSGTVTVNADEVDINSGNINLGASGVGVLNANTQFAVTGVQAGSATLPVTIVPGTASTSVKATS